ncbi:MAG: hypothetical protein SH818_11695 [Saprospiraceae bacterium]|nr:hypothetical protein [Saprospiraceae bacterium]
MQKRRLCFLIIGLSAIIYFARGQGCSDAGFCTLSSFKPGGLDSNSRFKNQFKIGVSYGSADHSISIFGTQLEYHRVLNKKLVINAKLASISQSGNGISAFGFSDLFLNMDYPINEIGKLTLGFKLPLNDGSKLRVNLPLPMDYQSSLGTPDLLLGISRELNKFHLALAFQFPLSQNQNEFFAEDYPKGSPLRQFQTTNRFVRRGDVMVRAAYPIPINHSFKITPGLLPIVHLGKDKYIDRQGIERAIDGSQGLTLNGTVNIDYEMNDNHSFQLNAGIPFIVRKQRPDGLTRSFIVALEYRRKF